MAKGTLKFWMPFSWFSSRQRSMYTIASDLRHPDYTVELGGLAGRNAALALGHRRFLGSLKTPEAS